VTIYVDNMRGWARGDRGSGRVVTGRWSHLLADDPDELAGFAARLGLRPEWLQFPGTPREHYDIVEAVRRRAVAAGAVPISYPLGTGNLILTKRLQASALDAAGRGWQVFPLRPGTKIPALRDWEHQATADPERIRDLWTVRLRRDGWYVAKPRNVGIACGPSGLVVIDLDVAKPDRTGWAERWLSRDINSGADVLTVLAARAGYPVPQTYVVVTPSGGRHLYLTAPAGVGLRSSAGRLGPMIDIRGEGGYVVAAGSQLHARSGEDDVSAEPCGLGYRLVEDRRPAELPGWLTAAITAGRPADDNPIAEQRHIDGDTHQALDSRSKGYGTAALRGEVDRVRSAQVGQRNHTLNTAAYSLGQLVAAGALDQHRAVEALTAAAESAGLTTAEIGATIESGLAAGAKRPRAIAPRRSPASGTEPAIRSSDGRDTDIEREDGAAVSTDRPAYWTEPQVDL
jgi:hypothetical protein